jgi:hypothetical protein
VQCNGIDACNEMKECSMNRLLKTVVFAAATTAATWAMKRWLDNNSARLNGTARKKPVHDWENEGGALAPQPFGVETSQVPR